MHRFRDILFLATTPAATPALFRAAEVARVHDAALTLAGIRRSSGGGRRAGLGASTSLSGEGLAALAAAVEGTGVPVRVRPLPGQVSSVIEAVEEGGHDLVIKEVSPLGGLRERLFGGADQQLLRTCPCPVWLCRPESEPSLRSVLAAVDVSSESGAELAARVIRVGSWLAAREGAEFHAVHAWSLPSEALLRARARGPQRAGLRARLRATRRERRQRLESLLARETAPGVAPEGHLVNAPAAVGIERAARRVNADVVVVGTACRRGIQGVLIGNTAEAVLPRLHSVLTVRAPGSLSAGYGRSKDSASRLAGRPAQRLERRPAYESGPGPG